MSYADYDKALNAGQKAVMQKLQAGENVFITGNAGTGKSFLVSAYTAYCKEHGIELVRTAPTGIAAQNISGATLHSQFKLKTTLDFEKPKKVPEWLKQTDALLIDEISMVRIDVFDKIMQYVAIANEKRPKSKKPIQMVFCGDFFQLAPVIPQGDKPHLTQFYKKSVQDGYCFQSSYWKMFQVQLCKLTEVVRQDDKNFCAALDLCKEGNASCLSYFNTHMATKENPNMLSKRSRKLSGTRTAHRSWIKTARKKHGRKRNWNARKKVMQNSFRCVWAMPLRFISLRGKPMRQ